MKIIAPNTIEKLREVHQQKRLGSSEMAVLAGLNPWSTPLELWALKSGKAPLKAENLAMKMGTYLEPVVAKLYQEETGRVVEKNDHIYEGSEPWMVAIPDYYYDNGEAILECKTTGAWKYDDWMDDIDGATIPDFAHIQLQWQMGILGKKKGSVACLIGGRQFVHKEIEFNQDVFDQLVELGRKFIKLVDDGTPPEAIAQDTPPPPTDFDTTLSLAEVGTLVEQYQDLAVKKKEAAAALKLVDDAQKSIKNQISFKMGDKSKALCGPYSIKRTFIHMPEKTVKAYSMVRFSIKEII